MNSSLYQQDLGQFILFAIVVIIFLSWFLFKRIMSNIPEKDEGILKTYSQASLIMTIYTIGVSLMKVSTGKINLYPYTILVTTPMDINQKFNPSSNYTDSEIDTDNLPKTSSVPIGDIRSPIGQMIMKIDLPVKSSVHISGFSLNDNKFKMLLGNTNLESSLTQVKLEGNFPEYFRLYCSNGKEVELLELLDPTNMQFLVDFCESFNFELIDTTLYFTKSNASNKSDNGILTKSAEDFANRILPILLRMTITTLNQRRVF
jgi:hypothetical protein